MNNHLFTSALCLVLVLEGLFLFAVPDVWKRMADQMRQLDSRQLRTIGAVMMVIGVIALRIFV
jgi:uncharacterized protein YjeT (DUF2065 family)